MRMRSEPSKVQPATDWQILFRVKLSQESWTQVGTDAVRNDIFPTVEELGRENGNGYTEKGISYDNEDTNLGHKVVSDDGWVSQWMADGHIAVIGHDHECAGLHGEEIIHDEHLEETGREADGPEVKPEDGQDLGDGSEAEHHAQEGGQAEQVVHGLVQRGLQLDGDQEGGAGPHGQNEEEAEGQGQPVLPTLVAGEADEEEFRDWSCGVVAG